ncbi:tRNA (adenosine(37)-N6)-threonylcarbamoyltransferase complex dimerization subunit type 1 TsaB [Lipingzhangella sp. LS1_29]|uniref:tRNA (Adenosine(37)-N6)-threonylcarbamoyltransferase complex dimerization subunit type 1 TsaB n=1 Tax=Lipingzhangella rawalii TaxID=2055835 RepID=A0ABU2H3W2_9ACTN|nr:tRNA (adenosine(37)-N6)-threonylcarbamoyltransferase complex dimerization subunit type 1 TsaB [Lipingzhangella rawalii]MDS1269993.1 tRNA (adenosine(37)-N6)-threonylcarbamoyltransferase complex dimerization subunit type 1 TsaB [Lipingzhangella rawalii]
MFLAFDTATPAVTIAVCSADATGQTTVHAATDTVDARRHGELLAPGIRATVDRAGITLADVSRIVVGIGPGPFTGLRVGVAAAHALAQSLRVPCHGIPTLDAIAAAADRSGPFLVASDARRKEVFWARYSDPYTRAGDIAVSPPDEAAAAAAGLPVLGHGAALYPQELGESGQEPEPLYPSAAALCTLAARALAADEPLAEAHPLYLRRPDAQRPGAPKRVAQWRQS